MEKEIVLACILGPFYLVYGLSILMYPKQWKKLVAWLEQNHFAFLPMSMFGLIFGLILVNAYNVWTWSPFLIITLTGWAILFKAIFYFLAPGKWITGILHWRTLMHTSFYSSSGAFLALMGGILMWYGYGVR